MNEIINQIQRNILFFYKSCGEAELILINGKKIKKEFSIENDIPIIFFGIANNFVSNEPQYYWNREVMDEIFYFLKELKEKDSSKFRHSFMQAQKFFFYAINSYDNIIKIYNEMRDVEYDADIKTRIFRNPIYSQLCEDCLMHFFRLFGKILTDYDNKDYTKQNTLGQIIPVLQKKNLTHSTDININLRNSINHGNLFINSSDSKIIMRYQKDKSFVDEDLSIYQYDKLIDQTLDIASGIFAGIIKFMIFHDDTIQDFCFDTKDDNIKYEWIKIHLRCQHFKIQCFNTSISGSPQLNLHSSIDIQDKNCLVMALIQAIKYSYLFFPLFERYFASYNINNLISGFIRINNNDIEKHFDNEAELYQQIINNKDILLFDTKKELSDIRSYKYYMLPKISHNFYKVHEISNSSVDKLKRFTATILITNQNIRKTKLKSVIKDIIDKIRILYTPQHPYLEMPYGKKNADAVFLRVFKQSHTRNTFNISSENKFFICLAEYYRNKEIQRIKVGSVHSYPELHNEDSENIYYAWNPNYLKRK